MTGVKWSASRSASRRRRRYLHCRRRQKLALAGTPLSHRRWG
ncbi:hypothetical protein L840_1296 [Mycobacterium sp. MAC_011194_8550]|nr:hypothetical protein L840_1296 [Mycobacterium sp. MAC_011194_8550]